MKKKSQLLVALIAILYPLVVGAQSTREVPETSGGGGGGGAPSTTAITTGIGLKNGKVWIWGFRGSGQQGNGTTSVSYLDPPTAVAELKNIVFVTGGAYHLLAIDGRGKLYGWGQNGYGETGCGSLPVYVNTPCTVKLPNPIVQAAAGEYHSVILDNAGDVYTVGLGSYGRLGHGNALTNKTPTKVNLEGERARLVGGAYEGSFAVTHEGNVWAWGRNMYYALGLDASTESVTWPTKIPNLKPYAKKIVSIAGGYQWGQALLADGTVIGWGYHGAIGQTACNAIGQSTSTSARPVQVKILDYVKDANGKIVPVEKKVIQLGMRYLGSIALTSDNQVYTWGNTAGSAFPAVYGFCPTKRETVQGRIVRVGTAKESVTYELENGAVYGVGYNSLGGLNESEPENVRNWPGIRLKDIPD